MEIYPFIPDLLNHLKGELIKELSDIVENNFRNNVGIHSEDAKLLLVEKAKNQIIQIYDVYE